PRRAPRPVAAGLRVHGRGPAGNAGERGGASRGVRREPKARLAGHGGPADPRALPSLLRGARAPPRAVLVPDPTAGVRIAADERRDEPVHPVFPRTHAAAIPPG